MTPGDRLLSVAGSGIETPKTAKRSPKCMRGRRAPRRPKHFARSSLLNIEELPPLPEFSPCICYKIFGNFIERSIVEKVEGGCWRRSGVERYPPIYFKACKRVSTCPDIILQYAAVLEGRTWP